MAPRVGGVGKAVQQENEWTFTLFKVGELKVVSADALHSVFLPDDRSHAAQLLSEQNLDGRDIESLSCYEISSEYMQIVTQYQPAPYAGSQRNAMLRGKTKASS